MALFRVDGRGPTAPGADPTHGGAVHGAAAVDEHLGALLGEHILPVRHRRSSEDPYLLAVDVLGSPVVVEVVGMLDGPTLLRALAQLGRATRFSLRDLAARYHGGSDRFLPDLATFRESVPASRLAVAARGPRLLVVCTQLADGLGDAVAALDGRGVDVLRATRVEGPNGPLLDVSPVHLAVPDGTWSVSHGVAALATTGDDAAASWRAAAADAGLGGEPGGPTAPMRSTATGLPDALSRSRAWRRVLDDDALERRPATGPLLDGHGAAGGDPRVGATTDRRAEPRLDLRLHPASDPRPDRASDPRPDRASDPRPDPRLDRASDPRLDPRLDRRTGFDRRLDPRPSGDRRGTGLADGRSGLDHAGPISAVPSSVRSPQPVRSSQPAPATPPAPRVVGDPRLAALAVRGPVPLVWIRERRGQRFEARLLPDGLVELPDGTHLSDPSRAAELVSGTPGVDGWRVWRLAFDGPTLGEAVGR